MRATQSSEIAGHILQALWRDPRNYRNFGIYWWPVKALLRGYYTVDDCYMLGGYEDPEIAAMVPPGTQEETLGRALAEYEYNARFNLLCSQVTNEEGEEVTIYDEDAGL